MDGSVKNVVLGVILLAWIVATVAMAISLIGLLLFIFIGDEWVDLGRDILNKIK